MNTVTYNKLRKIADARDWLDGIKSWWKDSAAPDIDHTLIGLGLRDQPQYQRSVAPQFGSYTGYGDYVTQSGDTIDRLTLPEVSGGFARPGGVGGMLGKLTGQQKGNAGTLPSQFCGTNDWMCLQGLGHLMPRSGGHAAFFSPEHGRYLTTEELYRNIAPGGAIGFPGYQGLILSPELLSSMPRGGVRSTYTLTNGGNGNGGHIVYGMGDGRIFEFGEPGARFRNNPEWLGNPDMKTQVSFMLSPDGVDMDSTLRYIYDSTVNAPGFSDRYPKVLPYNQWRDQVMSGHQSGTWTTLPPIHDSTQSTPQAPAANPPSYQYGIPSLQPYFWM